MKIKATSTTILLFIYLCLSTYVWGQNGSDFSKFLEASKEDASKLIEGYTSPVIRGLSYSMTGGWYHTAKTHKSFGVDIGVSINAVFLPSSENYFTPTLSNGQFTNTTNPGMGAPTIFGPKDATSYTTTYDPDGSGPMAPQSVTFSGPEGLDFKNSIGFAAVPAPMAQIGIGLIKNTDLKIRYIPKITRNNSQVQMLGFGLMHDIKQHLPGVKELPFELAVLVGYNSIKMSSSLVNTDSQDQRPDSPDGKVSGVFNSWIFQGIISRKISVMTLYAGAGYGFVSTNMDITGTYKIQFASGGSIDITDPLAYNFSNKSARFTGGIRFKFGPLYIHGDYTFQKYNNLSVGAGFTIK